MQRSAIAVWPHWPWALCGAYAIALAAVRLNWPALPQDPSYHQFADTRSWLGIPRFGDVASNAALLLAGLAGLAVLPNAKGAPSVVKRMQCMFFASVVLTALGSAYYHWAPDSPRLIWDRLPLAVVAACFPVLVLADRATLTGSSRWVLALWLIWAPLTVGYWYLGEMRQAGDLWPYSMVKLVAIAATAALLVLLPARHSLGWVYWVGLAGYVLAGIAEARDTAIFAATGIVSGHTLKHLLAGLAVAAFAAMVAARTELPGMAHRT